MEQPKSQGSSRRIIVGLSLAAVAVGIFLFWPGGTPTAEPVPSPNGYDDFLKAAALLSPATIASDPRDLPEEKLRELVAQNSAALKLVRAALELQCRVPVVYSTNYMAKHLEDLQWFRPLAKALVGEGRLAELDQRTNDAARCYIDAIRLGHEIVRGGTMLDHLVGVACESTGSSRLTKIVPSLDAKECRFVIARLESIEDRRESPDETLRIERAWARLTGIKERISNMIAFKSLDPAKLSHKKYLVRLEGEIARQAQLRIDLARRAYVLEHGSPPSGLRVLVPDYLKSLPQMQPAVTNTLSGAREVR